jgi:hypothetical protein
VGQCQVPSLAIDFREQGVYTVSMIRINLYIPEKQRKTLRDLAINTGITVSEHIRRALDEYIKKIVADDSNKNE